MKKLRIKTVSRYFLYVVLCVCVFLITYLLGSMTQDTLFWHKTVEFNSPRPIGGLILLFLIDLCVCFVIWLEMDLD